jgi:hypothetical protein
MSEAFVYMWHDSKNSMYYIGYHQGTPDDGYTHSSKVMEQFKAHSIPEGFSRRILAYGTVPDMKQLEIDLLNNRKEKCWDKYYNVVVCFPPPTKSGKDNHLYVHGRGGTPEYYKEYREKNREEIRERQRENYKENREKIREQRREYYKENREELLEKERKYHKENREKIRERKRKYREKNREKDAEYQREYREKNREKIRERDTEYQREYREKNREKLREKNREYREKNREKLREKNRERYARKKAEKIGKSTLDNFLT